MVPVEALAASNTLPDLRLTRSTRPQAVHVTGS
jgi:hypothetical protein